MAVNQLQLVRPVKRMERNIRSPRCPFQLRQEAWQITPFLCHPVLPGETLKHGFLQHRIISDPVKSKLHGWWYEHALIYVPLRALDHVAGDTMYEDMMLELDKDMSTKKTAVTDTFTYTWGAAGLNGMDYVQECLDFVVGRYFRDEDDAASHQIGGKDACSVDTKSWLDSVINDDEFINSASVDVDVDALGAGANIMASEIEKAMAMFEYQRAHALTDMTFEDYLRTYGISAPVAQQDGSEILRVTRNWTNPTSHIDPTDGSPTTAMVWNIKERIDKNRLFKEPGFIFGVTTARPKVYFKGQTGLAIGLMDDAMAWLPAAYLSDTMSSFRKVTALEGPLTNTTDDYHVDIKDILMYGEAFVNFALTEADACLIDLPTAGLEKAYASDTDADSLWVTSATQNLLRSEGLITMHIASPVLDTSPSVNTVTV